MECPLAPTRVVIVFLEHHALSSAERGREIGDSNLHSLTAQSNIIHALVELESLTSATGEWVGRYMPDRSWLAMVIRAWKASNLPDPHPDGQLLALYKDEWPELPAGEAITGVRAENIQVTGTAYGPRCSSAKNWVRHAWVHTEQDGAAAVATSHDVARYEPGAAVAMDVNPPAIHLFDIDTGLKLKKGFTRRAHGSAEYRCACRSLRDFCAPLTASEKMS